MKQEFFDVHPQDANHLNHNNLILISIFWEECWNWVAKQIFKTSYRLNGTCTWPVHGNTSACIFLQAKYNSQRLFFQPLQLRTAVYFLHINLGRTISLFLVFSFSFSRSTQLTIDRWPVVFYFALNDDPSQLRCA